MLYNFVKLLVKKLFSDNKQSESVGVHKIKKIEQASENDKEILPEHTNDEKSTVAVLKQKNCFTDPDEIHRLEEQGIVFSKDKKTLVECINKEITEVVIPNDVTVIGEYAFEDCTNLTSVVIPDGVTEIGNSAFVRCTNLTDVVIPDGVTKIGSCAFAYCTNLTSVVIPDGVTKIDYQTFRYCEKLVNFIIPPSVTEIATEAFDGCASLNSINIPEGVCEIGKYGFAGCKNLSCVIILCGISEIKHAVFAGCKKLTNIIIPEGVTKIGTYAFSSCLNLVAVSIPSSVTEIEENAFKGSKCEQQIARDYGHLFPYYGLSEAEIAIRQAENQGIIFSEDKKTLLKCTDKNIVSTTIPYGVTEIGDEAFEWCRELERISIPEGVIKIGKNAFVQCSRLSKICLPSSINEIGDYAFHCCKKLTSFVIPDGITKIGDSTFDGCDNLTNVTIPLSVTEIGSFAFCYCSKLSNLTLPQNLNKLGAGAFKGCDNLKIHLPENVTIVFSDWCYFSRHENGGRYGVFEEKSATMAVPAIYDDVAIMYDESGALIEKIVNIKENGKWRLYQIGSGFIENPEFKKIGHLREGKQHVSFLDELHGFIDEQGEIALPFVYADCKSFSDGLCAVKFIPAHEFDPNDGWGYIDHQGNVVVQGQYGDACKFHDGYARVQAMESNPYDIRAVLRDMNVEGNWGIIDKSGHEILPCEHNLDSISRQLKILRRPSQQKLEFSYSPVSGRIAISRDHVFVALESGKVICLDHKGEPSRRYNIVSSWHNVEKIAAGFDHAIALTFDGQILTTGNSKEFSNSYTVSSWRNVSQIAACEGHTAAVAKDGNVLIATEAGGWEASPVKYGQHLQTFSDIEKVAVSWLCAAALKKDGTVLMAGECFHDRACEMKDWSNIVDIDIFGCYYSMIQTVGLTSTGKVVTTKEDLVKKIDQWENIVSVSCGNYSIVALNNKGKVFFCGYNEEALDGLEDWPEMQAVKTGFFRTVGIDKDGFIWISKIGRTSYNFFDTK